MRRPGQAVAIPGPSEIGRSAVGLRNRMLVRYAFGNLGRNHLSGPYPPMRNRFIGPLVFPLEAGCASTMKLSQ